MLRYLTSLWVNKYNPSVFPFATFTVNILGCLLMGLLIGQVGVQGQAEGSLKLLLITGFCGGYTTFSAFAQENLDLLQNQGPWMAVGYTMASILFGVGAVWMGMALAKPL